MHAELAPTREQRLWSQEVARVLAAAPTFEDPVRRAVLATLRALGEDPSSDEATREDVRGMLHVVDDAPSMPPLGRRIAILAGPRGQVLGPGAA